MKMIINDPFPDELTTILHVTFHQAICFIASLLSDELITDQSVFLAIIYFPFFRR